MCGVASKYDDELERDVEGNGFGLNYGNIPALAEGKMESYRIDSSRMVGVRALTEYKSQTCYLLLLRRKTRSVNKVAIPPTPRSG